MISERAIEMQKGLYLCFIDYTKAFDKVKHEEPTQLMQSLDIDGKDLRLLRNLYWEQTSCMRVDNELSKFTKIKRGMRQGCVLSPDLFGILSAKVFQIFS